MAGIKGMKHGAKFCRKKHTRIIVHNDEFVKRVEYRCSKYRICDNVKCQHKYHHSSKSCCSGICDYEGVCIKI